MRYSKVLSPLLLSTLLLLGGCGGGNSSESTSQKTSAQTFTQAEKAFVHDLFMTEYLWYEDVPENIDYDTYTTPQSLVDALRVDPPDRWSFALSAQEYESMINQKTSGFGFGYLTDYTIYMVLIGSPAEGKLRRGDRIVEVNGEAVSSELLQTLKTQTGTPATFTVIRNGESISVDVTPKDYTYKVTEPTVLSYAGRTVGYLRYDAFTGTSVDALEHAFTTFKDAGVQELVIDLRYNGGGTVTAASILLDNISNTQPGARQFYLDWNANYKSRNETYYFSTEVEPNDLNMQRVFFLVMRNSASASELVISALKPYLGDTNIITVGSATHGKSVGMTGRSYGSNYYFLINFFVRNDRGETTGFDGIPPTCTAPDDLTHLRNDPNETMLHTALQYIATGSCP
jgi:C-terminal processing protease CtpA/Prc